MMTGRERMLAALKEGGSPDDIPSVLIYTELSLLDAYHFWEAFSGGKPWWTRSEWSHDIFKRLEVEAKMQEILGLDWMYNCFLCRSREWRKTHRVLKVRGGVYMADVGPPAGTARDKEFRGRIQPILQRPLPDGSREVLRVSRDILARKYGLDMTELIKGKEDIERYVVVEKAEELIDEGKLDYVEAVVERFGEDKFILAHSGWTPLSRVPYLLGYTNTLKMMITNPKLLKQISDRYADKLIEEYTACAKMGADGTFTWESITGQYVSPAQFDEFVKPYTMKVAKACRQLGFKYIYGTTGVGKEWMEGLESMLDIPMDAIQLEEAVKGMDTDLSWQAPLLESKGLKNKVALMGNVATINVIKDGTSAELEREVKRQVDIGSEYGKFILSAGAPITPDTTLERLLEYLRLARKYCRRKP